ncbi:MAG TPA: hypothetical protein VJB15_09665 [Rhodothermia bacterium]|nr:hypothetical protein [Rhodothermia bacterium]
MDVSSRVREKVKTMSILTTRYRLDLLPQIFPFHRRARRGLLEEGELVYYGPMPSYYGIGEIVRISDRYIVVDFRGTGQFGVHEDTLAPEYLIPIPPASLQLL